MLVRHVSFEFVGYDKLPVAMQLLVNKRFHFMLVSHNTGELVGVHRSRYLIGLPTYGAEKCVFLPNIFASNGNAELSTTISAQLAITRLKGVRLAWGRIRDIGGEVYKPIEEVTIRYSINTISRNAPKGPSMDRELIPRVNC